MATAEVDYLQALRREFNDRISFREKRPGIIQLVAPFYHEDGDMVDVFIETGETRGIVNVTDRGLTLMRLSYAYEIDTQNKERILRQILRERGIENRDGMLVLPVAVDDLYVGIMRFTQTVAAVMNMQLYRRDVIRSMFYEMLDEFVMTSLTDYLPEKSFVPLVGHDEWEVDYKIASRTKPLFIFGVKDGAKARLAAVSCLEFLRNKIQFRSLAVHEDFEALPVRERKIITNVVDKQYTDLDDFQRTGKDYILRETA